MVSPADNNQINSIKAVKEISSYLEKNDIDFTIVQSPRNIDDEAMSAAAENKYILRSVLLQDDESLFMAVLPCDRMLDFTSLCGQLQKNLVPIQKEKVSHYFADCEPGSYPPLPNKYRFEAIIDTHIEGLQEVYFEPGTKDILMKISGADYVNLHKNVKQLNFTQSLASLDFSDDVKSEKHHIVSPLISNFLPISLQEQIEDIVELPAIPVTANEILKLRTDPDADGKKLAKIIEKDPSLAAQLLSWAQSPYYQFGGDIHTIEDAIIKVLGFEMVMNLSIGIAIGRSLSVPVDGPLGLREFWRFAILTSALVEKLAIQIPAAKRPMRGMAYLAGLLHNFGHLILAHVFPPHFYILNHYVLANPGVSILKIERHVLGVSHQKIGSWLTQAWNLPGEIIAAVKWHHQEEYVSEYSAYSNLVYIATRLLKRFDLGDAEGEWLSDAVLESLDLNNEKIEKALEHVMGNRYDLTKLADKLIS